MQPGNLQSRPPNRPAGFVTGLARLAAACGGTWPLAGVVFLGSFLFRFMVQPDLTNDFFMHVVGGRQMLLGDWPVRDFVDQGLPLMFATSALAEWIGGPTLLSEVTVALVFMSLGAGLVFVLATEASGSRMVGLLVTLPVVLVAPRLYAYPKLFCHPLAVWVMWRYLDRPNAVRVLVLGAVTAVAFLFRHDHGVYIGLATTAALVVHHWPRGVVGWSRAVGAYALVVVLFLAPYLVFVQVNGGLVSHVQTGVEFSRSEEYDLVDFSRASMRALIGDPVVEDSTLDVDGEPLLSRLRRQMPPVALAVAYAVPILFTLAYLLPVAAIGFVIYRWVRHRGGAEGADEPARILGLACLALLVNMVMLRDSPELRIADAVALPAIVGAWLAGVAGGGVGVNRAWFRDQWFWLRAGGVSMRSVAHAVFRGGSVLGVCVALGMVCAAAAAQGGLTRWIDRAGFEQGVAAAVVAGVTNAYRTMSTSPAAVGWLTPNSEQMSPIVRYLHDCTRPADRVFVVGFWPDVVFFSGRGFAGGHGTYEPGLHASPRSQGQTLHRLQRQSVPFALLFGGANALPPLIDDHFSEWYRPVTTIDPTNFEGLTVMVDRRRIPSGRYAPLDAPCFS